MSSTPTPAPTPFVAPAQTAEQVRHWGAVTQILLSGQAFCLLGLALLTLVGTFGPVMFVTDFWMLQEALRSLLSGLFLLVCAAGVVGWLRWQYLCGRLVDDGSPTRTGRVLRRSPGWHVASWFVPVLCLWWPPQNVADLDREAWRRALDPGQPARPAIGGDPGSGLLLIWWSTWLLAGGLSWPVSYAPHHSAAPLLASACVVAAACAACAVLLVRRISNGLTGVPEASVSEILGRWFPGTAHAPPAS